MRRFRKIFFFQFGHDSKLTLEYSWDPPNKLKTEQEEVNKDEDTTTEQPTTSTTEQPTKSTTQKLDLEKPENCDTKPDYDLSVTLQRLLSIAKLHYRKERVQCPCGHICGGPKSNSANRHKNITAKTNQKNNVVENNDVSQLVL